MGILTLFLITGLSIHHSFLDSLFLQEIYMFFAGISFFHYCKWKLKWIAVSQRDAAKAKTQQQHIKYGNYTGKRLLDGNSTPRDASAPLARRLWLRQQTQTEEKVHEMQQRSEGRRRNRAKRLGLQNKGAHRATMQPLHVSATTRHKDEEDLARHEARQAREINRKSRCVNKYEMCLWEY